MKILDRYRGCLIGGAAGDALGYAVEFLSAEQIFQKYGGNGITDYDLVDGAAQISDDTQMTLFTANGLLIGTTRGRMRGIMAPYPSYIFRCYQDWLNTQATEDFEQDHDPVSWLYHIPELHHSREPGRTCINALVHGRPGSIEEPLNQSKGCGGVMRVAPVGLYFIDEKYPILEIDRIGAETAALTHGHELGYLPAAALVHIIHMVAHDSNIPLLAVVQDSMKALPELFPKAVHLQELLTLMEKAVDLSSQKLDDLDAIRELGEGWVAEETLAIAVYCALKYQTDFNQALIAAVNHDGDSDSTGAVTGNILGAYLGLSGIPQKYLDHLELKDIIFNIADDLYHDCKMSEFDSFRDEIWIHKYIQADYPLI